MLAKVMARRQIRWATGQFANQATRAKLGLKPFMYIWNTYHLHQMPWIFHCIQYKLRQVMNPFKCQIPMHKINYLPRICHEPRYTAACWAFNWLYCRVCVLLQTNNQYIFGYVANPPDIKRYWKSGNKSHIHCCYLCFYKLYYLDTVIIVLRISVNK